MTKKGNDGLLLAVIGIFMIILLSVGLLLGCSDETYESIAAMYDAEDAYSSVTETYVQAIAIVDMIDNEVVLTSRVGGNRYDRLWRIRVVDVAIEEESADCDILYYSSENIYENEDESDDIHIYIVPYYDDYEYEIEISSELPQRPPRNPDEKLIALTFDDGPSRHTQRLLDILAKYDSVATFFVLGGRVWDHRYIMQNMIAQGSEAAGHAWHHVDLTRLEAQDIKDQITYTDNAIAAVTGERPPPFFRPPFGHFNSIVREVAQELGVALIHWNINPNDWRYRDADFIYEYIMYNARNGGIVLLHDIHETTVDAMERVIPSLVERGFRLVTVSYLLGETVPGNVYFSEFSSR